jgi:hypothetical protein
VRIFISHSFDSKDKSVFEWFEKKIKELLKGVEIVTARKAEYKPVWKKIKNKIHSCVGIVGICTRANKIERKKEYKTKSWVLTELAYGVGRDMPSFAFIEKGVKDLGLISTREFVPFDRNRLNGIESKLKEYICSVLKPYEDQTHMFESYDKRACIYANGHGICESIITLRVLSNRFKRITHSFALGASAKKNVRLPSFNFLKRGGICKRFSSHTFSVKVLDGYGRNRTVEIKEDEHSSGSAKRFHIYFKPNLKAGDRVRYSWAWSSPDLYPVKASDLKPGKRREDKKSVESILVVRHCIKELKFRLTFEDGLKFARKPQIVIEDHNGNLLRKINHSCHQTSYYIVYDAEISPVPYNSRIVAKWNPA